jgi:hypothetical protein
MSSARPMKCSVSQIGHRNGDIDIAWDSDVLFR